MRSFFQSESRQVGSVTRLVCRGDIDRSTIERFDRELSLAVHQSPLRVVVDLSDVEFIDSAGIALLAAHATTGPTEIVVAGPRPNVRRIITIAGLDRVLHLEP